MYEECSATLSMERMILSDGYFDETVYHCKIIRYNPEEERIYLLTGKTELPSFSLDGIYMCGIETQGELLECRGMIRERYWNKLGRIIVFQIRNGFYKKVLN